MTPLQHNMLSVLHDGEHCYFTKFEMLRDTLTEIIKKGKPCVLISGNSDFTHDKNSVDWMLQNAPVKTFYAQNLAHNCENVYQLPLGITNVTDCARGAKHGANHINKPKHSNKIKHLYDDGSTPQKLIYANFRLSTNPQHRRHCANVASSAPFTTYENHGVDLEVYFEQCRDHKMIVCPDGNGLDTHRVWETLAIGRVPIVMKKSGVEQFRNLPIVLVDQWEELHSPDKIIDKYEEVKDNNKDMIYKEYWLKHILNKIGEIK